LEKANQLLQYDAASVTDIAFLVGFSSQTYFSKCFHEHFGQRPGDIKFKKIPEIGILKRPVNWNYAIAGAGLIIVLIVVFSSISQQEKTFSNTDILDDQIDKKSIAFLPLENISDVSNDYLARGFKTEIDRYLRDIPNLKIYSGLDVERLVNKNMSYKEIGNELGVTFILDGTIWKEKNRFKLNMYLTDVNSEEILWDDSYLKEYEQVMEVASEVAKNLSTELQIVLTSEEDARISALPTTSPEAYELNMKAWQTWIDAVKAATRNEKDSIIEISRNFALKAMEYDSNYINPLHLIASIEAWTGNIDSAKIIADNLVKKFPDDMLGYKLNAGICLMNHDFDKALELYQISYSKSPNDSWINIQLGRIHCILKNDYLTGIPYLIKGSFMPAYPGKPSFRWLADAYMSIGDYEKAMLLSMRDLSYESSCRNVYSAFYNYTVQGKYEQCLNFLDSISTMSVCDNYDPFYFITHIINGDFEKASHFTTVDSSMWEIRFHIAYLEIKSGNAKEGKILLNELLFDMEANHFKREYIGGRTSLFDSQFRLARVYSLLGEKKNVLKSLKKCEGKGFWYGHHDEMMSSPIFDGLKDDLEFIAIYEKTQKEKAAIRAKVREMEEYEEY
jgi:TolB-like protein